MRPGSAKSLSSPCLPEAEAVFAVNDGRVEDARD